MTELVGWLAAGLTLLTFSMRSMEALRLAGLGSNICFIAYGFIGELPPVLALHLLLLPCNLVRLAQLHRAAVPKLRPALGPRRRACFRAGIVAAMLALVPFGAAGDGAPGTASPRNGASPGVPVVLQAARCGPDLIDCADIDIPAPSFASIDSCRSFMAGFYAHAALAGKPALARVLLRCRYAPWVVRRPSRK